MKINVKYGKIFTPTLHNSHLIVNYFPQHYIISPTLIFSPNFTLFPPTLHYFTLPSPQLESSPTSPDSLDGT